MTLIAIRAPKRPIPRGAALPLRGLPRRELQTWLEQTLRGPPAYRGEQLFSWIHRRDAASFDDMLNLPRAMRVVMAEQATLERLRVDHVQHARDGTRKFRLLTTDGAALECVWIPNAERGATLCISSQVGCGLTCRFCATGTLGLERHLSADEIVDQVYAVRRWFAAHPDAQSDTSPDSHSDSHPDSHSDSHPDSHNDGIEAGRLSNLVFMGMGEPMHNYANLTRALEILTDPNGLALAGRRITVSTSGLVPVIERFARDGWTQRVKLAISLNATTDAIRDEVMPLNTRWPIAELMRTVRAVPLGPRLDLTFEYVLLADVNDSDDDARRLVHLTSGLRCHINLIPLNPHPDSPYARPRPERVDRFLHTLRRGGCAAWIRTPRGDDIDAACGQLARRGLPSDNRSTATTDNTG